MQNFSDVWKDSRSRHVQGRKAEFLQHSLNIAKRYIPHEMREEYDREVEEEKTRMMDVYDWANEEDRKRENDIIFGSASGHGG